MTDYYQPLHNIAPAFSGPPTDVPLTFAGAIPTWPPTSYAPLYIPVAGPSPYNSLVLVRTVISGTTGSGPSTQGMAFDLTTNFVFPGYDFRNAGEIAFRHSSIVYADMFQATEELNFDFDQTQVNSGFFSDTGNWTISVNFFGQISGAQNPGEISMRWRMWSWILC